MYTININYDTGDSFNSYPNQEETIELEFKNLEIAKENLIAIKEHYKLYKSYENSYSRKKDNEALENEYKDRYWKVSSNDPWADKYRINFKTDDGKIMQIYCFWCGYFENLNYAEVVPVKANLSDSDMIIYA